MKTLKIITLILISNTYVFLLNANIADYREEDKLEHAVQQLEADFGQKISQKQKQFARAKKRLQSKNTELTETINALKEQLQGIDQDSLNNANGIVAEVKSGDYSVFKIFTAGVVVVVAVIKGKVYLFKEGITLPEAEPAIASGPKPRPDFRPKPRPDYRQKCQTRKLCGSCQNPLKGEREFLMPLCNRANPDRYVQACSSCVLSQIQGAGKPEEVGPGIDSDDASSVLNDSVEGVGPAFATPRPVRPVLANDRKRRASIHSEAKKRKKVRSGVDIMQEDEVEEDGEPISVVGVRSSLRVKKRKMDNAFNPPGGPKLDLGSSKHSERNSKKRRR